MLAPQPWGEFLDIGTGVVRDSLQDIDEVDRGVMPSEILFTGFLDLIDIKSYFYMLFDPIWGSLSFYKEGVCIGRNREDEITPLQQETLDEICRYVSAKGYPPTIKKLSETFGIKNYT